MKSVDEQLELLCRGTAKVISKEALKERLAKGRPLRVKLGVDPTAPDIHLGHTVALEKLRQFQLLGHHVVLIIGDFTAMIGDPTGRSATRPPLTREEVLVNAETYTDQAFKILDREHTEVVYNGDWFRKMSYDDVLKLNARVTLQQMMQREDFRSRVEQAQEVRLHELQYPIMQGWDSVMVRSDVEIGGTDQLFNILVGRDLQKEEGMEQQIAVLVPILEGLDGVKKMSKSLGNYVGVGDAPDDMFGKIMSVSDALMGRYYTLLLGEEVDAEKHPMEAKKSLASRIVARYHNEDAAHAARAAFEARFSKKSEDAVWPAVAWSEISANITSATLVAVVVEALKLGYGETKSSSDVRRLIQQGSIQLNGEKLMQPQTLLNPAEFGTGALLKLDKKRSVRIV